jgi:hypothetical protein
MIAIGFSRRNGGGSSLSQEAQNWKDRIIANGGNIDSTILVTFDDYFFKPAKANGSILSELDRLNIYCGLNGYEIAARTNLIKSAHYVTPVSSPTFDNNGYKSSGTSYLNLNYTPSTEAVKFTLDSNSTFCVVKEPSFSGTSRMIGSSANLKRNDLVRENVPWLSTFNNSNAFFLNTNTVAIGNVFLAARRQNALNADAIINTSIVNSLGAPFSIATDVDFELTANGGGGTPDGNYDLNYHLSSGRGSGNVDLLSLRTILNNLFTQLGV